jgi:hypothetical protein
LKLQAVLARTSVDLPVIAGKPPSQTTSCEQSLATPANVDLLHQFAAERVRPPAQTDAERIDRARRKLSVLCSGARILADTVEPGTSLRLPTVVTVLGTRWPDSHAVAVLTAYDRFRQGGATDIRLAEDLARQAPDALQDLRDLVDEPKRGR